MQNLVAINMMWGHDMCIVDNEVGALEDLVPYCQNAEEEGIDGCHRGRVGAG